jgi:hypothetical protein
MIYGATRSVPAVQFLLDHSEIEFEVRNLRLVVGLAVTEVSPF